MYEEFKNDLAKVLLYYGLIESVSSESEKIICPFHEDANPSMIVNLVDGGYFCFGCGEAGDALKFVITLEKKLHGLNSLQAGKKYVKILRSGGMQKIKLDHVIKKKVTNKELYSQAYDYYHGLAKINWHKNFVDKSDNQVKSYMINRGFTEDILTKCGAKINYSGSYRIIFPMLDNGKFKGWVCRTTFKEIEKRRKYLYNEGFRRRTTLVGRYDKCEVIFVVEGYMDRLKFVQFGVNNVVAILGWKMSDQQIEKIKSQSKIKYIVSALDNDISGRKGSKYLEKVFQEKYLRFSYVKGVKDVGEMDIQMFRKCYDKTMGYIE